MIYQVKLLMSGILEAFYLHVVQTELIHKARYVLNANKIKRGSPETKTHIFIPRD